MIKEEEIIELLRQKGAYLFHREGQCLEFKEQFNLAGLADYFRDFAAFANNRGGCLIFGVTDTPRVASGLSEKSISSFQKIDPEKISGYLLDIFSSNITWEQADFDIDGKQFGVFKITESDTKPVIAKKDEGKDQSIRNGDIYYRYGGRTQKIQFAELESIINKRIAQNNKDWIDLVKDIGPEGPQGSIMLKTKQSLTDHSKGPFVVEQGLAKKLKFIKEGQFEEKLGATALKLVGDIVPVNTVEVERVIKENLFKEYPLSATDLANQVVKKSSASGKNAVWKAISENSLKGNSDYSAYNFRNKKQQDMFENAGKVSDSTPIIYNTAALDLLVKAFGK